MQSTGHIKKADESNFISSIIFNPVSTIIDSFVNRNRRKTVGNVIE